VAPEPGRILWRVAAAVWALSSILTTAWAFATPISAAPDEPAHFIRAASLWQGQLVEPYGERGSVVQAPQYVAFSAAQTCFAFEPNTSADCAPPVPGDQDEVVSAETTAGLYNPFYYALVGWTSLVFHDQSGLYAMRIVSGILVSLFVGLSAGVLASLRGGALPVVGLLAALTPMVFFLGGAVNPNSLEVVATLATFVSMLAIVRSLPGSDIRVYAGLLAASAVVAANMRGLSLLWVAIAILVPLALISWSRIVELLSTRAVQVAAGITFVGVLGAAIWAVTTNPLGGSTQLPGEVTIAPGVGEPGIRGFVWTVLATFQYALGMVGTFGWLDTPSPEFTFFVWSLLGGGLVLISLLALRGRPLVVVGIVFTAFLLIPPVIAGLFITEGGIVWQGRYILPVFVCVMVAAGVLLSDRIALSSSVANRLLISATVLVAVAHAYSFATALRRYAVGLEDNWLELLTPSWEPPGGIALWIGVMSVTVVAGTLLLVVVVRRALAAQSLIAVRSPSH